VYCHFAPNGFADSSQTIFGNLRNPGRPAPQPPRIHPGQPARRRKRLPPCPGSAAITPDSQIDRQSTDNWPTALGNRPSAHVITTCGLAGKRGCRFGNISPRLGDMGGKNGKGARRGGMPSKTARSEQACTLKKRARARSGIRSTHQFRYEVGRVVGTLATCEHDRRKAKMQIPGTCFGRISIFRRVGGVREKQMPASHCARRFPDTLGLHLPSGSRTVRGV
jgi:hypothetical protein